MVICKRHRIKSQPIPTHVFVEQETQGNIARMNNINVKEYGALPKIVNSQSHILPMRGILSLPFGTSYIL